MELDKTNIKSKTVSVILPLYKQDEQLPGLIATYTSALNKSLEHWELILVLNGEIQNTLEILKPLVLNHKNVKYFHLEKSGWGRAVKKGLSEASGDFVCYTNSARTDVEDLMLMFRYARVNDNVVVKAKRIVRENFFRWMGSAIYNLENRFLFNTPVWDVNGTPKIFPSKILKQIEIVSEDDLIDAEIMAKCFKNNIPIIEIPVVNHRRISGKSTTNIISAGKMYWGLLKLKKKI